MGNYRYISADTKRIMVELSGSHRFCEIAKLLNVHRKTVSRVVHLATDTGKVVRKPVVPGGPRKLNGLHLSVSKVYYLSEIGT